MTTAPAASITLNPSYRLPIGIVLLSLPVLFIQLGLGLALALLGLFLLYQSTTIRLVFTPTDLEVRRNDRLLKTFPYAEWLNWQVFWPSVPILFYFKEVNSIHFLPVLFDPQQVRECLDTYCGDCAETRSQP